nr:hypothetical protein [Tanacetum cinerariifolium]
MSLPAAFLRHSKASSGVTFIHFCSTTSEVNKKIKGDTPRHDHNKRAGDDIPDSAAAGYCYTASLPSFYPSAWLCTLLKFVSCKILS